MVLQLTSLQSRATETVVGVRVINGRDREVELNRFNNRRDGYIVVDSGERIMYGNPSNEMAEYWSICAPAFGPDLVHRES